jgi:hypothetical protein
MKREPQSIYTANPCWHSVCLSASKEVTMIQIAQIKRMMQLILIVLCTLFLVSHMARARALTAFSAEPDRLNFSPPSLQSLK